MSSSAAYTEAELVDSLQERDEKAFNYLYDHYAGALYGTIYPIVNNSETANDVLQEVFLNIWKKIGSYDPAKGRLFTWMLNVARNAAIDKIRSRGFRESAKNQPITENVDSYSQSRTDPGISDVGLKKLVSKLKDEYRLLIDLSYFQGYTHEEIARALNIPLGTVKTRIRTALLQLRTLIN